MEINYNNELKDYPNVMSLDKMREACHISKRTARRLLEEELIPCEITDKQTHKYLILKKDIIKFLEDRDIAPERYYQQAYALTYSRKKLPSERLMTSTAKKKKKISKSIETKTSQEEQIESSEVEAINEQSRNIESTSIKSIDGKSYLIIPISSPDHQYLANQSDINLFLKNQEVSPKTFYTSTHDLNSHTSDRVDTITDTKKKKSTKRINTNTNIENNKEFKITNNTTKTDNKKSSEKLDKSNTSKSTKLSNNSKGKPFKRKQRLDVSKMRISVEVLRNARLKPAIGMDTSPELMYEVIPMKMINHFDNSPDVLTPTEVVTILGIPRKDVIALARKKYFIAFWKSNQCFISKLSLISFLCANSYIFI